ncbi:DUF2442 domain-containing protein [Sinorhizobium meliloti]|uniref:DUF2442 domain-containing protein n=1 Tax=Rhizobium meliloti TaxID=382 RepID=UPI000EFDA967|nr:DUF2442 domain-containing protein [Sinorhizobium meliloti]RMC67258.1 DUF2442 domain-containing protein [Sinorhizobium meliloti]
MAKKRRGRRTYRRDKTGPNRKKSLGSGLDEIGFQPLRRRIVIECARDAEGPLKHPTPSGAHYDRSSGQIVVEFDNGSTFTMPARSLEGLVDASESELAEVEILGETTLHWESLRLDLEIRFLMRGIFGTRNFMAESATRATELHNKKRTADFAAWARPVSEFLSYNIPYNHKLGWEHCHMTAYEVGCGALVALGQAHGTVGGAKPRRFPERPSSPPRWDDISTTVLYVATQTNQLQYRPLHSRVQSSKADHREDRALANIAAAHGAGTAYATFNVYRVLEALGLVQTGHWTKAAETVLWRDNPMEWNLDFTSDARFIRAAFDAAAAVPDDIRSKIDAIVASADEETWLKQTPNVENAGKSGLPIDARRVPSGPSNSLPCMFEDSRRYHLDSLFYRRWRLGGGWLSDTEAKSALPIPHDPLAISMRKAVMSWLYPSLPLLTL